MEILIVCTGNICRSPMAEALLRARLEAIEIPAKVHSAGLLFDGEPAEPYAVAALAKLGVDLRDHVARTITPDMQRRADLILTMEHRHIREAAMAEGGDLAKTFTLPDFVARAEADASEHGPRTAPLPDWIASIAAGRSSDEVMRADRSLEVQDPMGDSKRVFRKCAAELDDLVARLVAAAWPEPPADAVDPSVATPVQTRST